MRSAALPRPPFIERAGPPILPTVAPAPAPTVPIATGAAASPPRSPCSRSRRPDDSSRCCRPADRTGSPPARSAPWRRRTSQPMLCSSSHFTAPVAASRPNALPPERTIALTLSTMLSGLSRSVSRVPGAPPRCATPPAAPSPPTRITVQPVVPPASVWLPTLSPSTRPCDTSRSGRLVCRAGISRPASSRVGKDPACDRAAACDLRRESDARERQREAFHRLTIPHHLRSRTAGRFGKPVACVAARSTAVAMTSAASAPIAIMSGAPLLLPVATANTVSPSTSV